MKAAACHCCSSPRPDWRNLRAMMQDRRFADPEKFAHVRQELGIDPPPEDDTVGRVARD